jgi:outer membrane protein assembly factor BamB
MRKCLSSILFLFVFARGAHHLCAASFPDPAPPKFMALGAKEAPVPQGFDRLKFHAAPKPLNPAAQTSDWRRLLGPHDDSTSPESHLLHDLPPEGPAKVWEVKKGHGYTSPAIEGAFLVLFHALAGRETIECLHPETGERYWISDYEISYRDRYGFADGPRGSPVIGEGRVVTLGVTSVLTCLDLKTGRIAWKRDLRKEFHVPQDFFGQGGTPLILDGKVIVNVGGKEGPVPDNDSGERYAALAKPGLCVGAFDLKTGALAWGVKDAWGSSYASPVPATMHDRKVVFVYAGGEGNPAIGGLLCLDPKDGTVLSRFPWRPEEYIQAIGSSPTVLPEMNRVFISTAYPKGRPLGGVMVEFDAGFNAKEVWRSNKFATHWMTPVFYDGFLYGVDGETENNAELVCFDAKDGTEKWRKDIVWEDTEAGRGRPAQLGILRASLLRADGKFLVLGELGTLLWMDLTPQDAKVGARTQLFYAMHTWCLPAVSRGLLYVMQNSEEQVRGQTGQRLMCFDLRGE